ncbi:xanthine dehydrogenase family protein molybdopterin-binding subunit [Chelatococcus composti]|jgi:Aerobic-type carbon monoxide dehydrogenase, large subunit CoxL/CutL homologs|uniref:Carbon-monoxide dehydrogenase large subunit n=1 Tax=Chelatococcus composti TaxID=1743235 RepID=A0A841K1W0_9HYPH|nr:xanthine dehydrogenase family protein molybdopterin-binding subunit [Chelatococcus composti]MBB6166507.1 carbon-monoxide dehydrogenase large subunit [Chelatococcus composti]MBS7734563.1 xanthine dehydrogenase family protein molybdopterin-binding subunit [Chelatococcus composti]GGG27804.1 carbon monoxide dehydrogenase [Chelatococcus composti]
MSVTHIGAAVRRKEDQRFITGRGRYTDDLSRPGQAHAYFLRSPHAHARIRSIDTSRALAMPGVLAVLTGEDLARDNIGGLICGWMIHSKDGTPMKAGPHPALAQGKVRYVGDHVAVVIAESLAQAKDAAEAIEVDYEVLPAIVDPATAAKAGGEPVHEVAPDNTVFAWHLGDKAATEAAFKAAKHVTTIDLVNNRLIPNALEPRAAIGEYDPGTDSYTLYTTSQNPHVARLVLSAFVGIAPENKLRVIAPDVGGGFGSKIFIYAEETVCVWAAKKVGRPVKWTAERTESFLADAHGRDHVTHAELALDEKGKILGLRVKTIANLGAYLSTFASSVPTYLYGPLLSGPYDIPAIYCEVDGVYTNTAPVDAYRGAGRPEATFVLERLVEVASRELGIDPASFRRRNYIRKFPHQTPVIMTYDIGDYHATLQKALELADYKNFGRRKRESARRGKLRGIGFSSYIEACGLAPSQAVGSLGAGVGLWESAEIRVNPTGSVEVLTGSHSHGQGHETTFAQLVSDRLGISIDQVTVVHGDTDKVQFGMGSYGSRSGAVGMSAIVKALDKIIAKGKKVAAHVLEASEGDIEFKDGRFSVAGTDRSLSFGDVALQAYIAHKFSGQELEPGLKEGAFYDPTNFTFPAGVHICELEIDPQTGVTRIERWTAVDDFGVVINPMIVEGQVHGGVAQGIGQALLEGARYDQDGQLVTASFMDYCMPRADDLPSFTVDMTVTPSPSNPLGIKGCGEAGAIAAPAAVINAITDALGHEDIAMPATPQAVWRACRKAPMRMAAE